MIGELAGVSVPRLNVPEAYVLPLARVLEQVARWTGVRSLIPVDVLETTAAGSLLFETKRSERELGMAYTPLRVALGEAVEEITKTCSGRVS
jgi:hypothetical protein